MGIHFISVLGTSLYEPVVYYFPNKEHNKKEQEFIQIALISEFREQILENGKASIFLTNGARLSNWEEREYQTKDIEISEKWVSDKKLQIGEGKNKPGMKAILQKEGAPLFERTNGILISDARTEEEIWTIFETIYQTIEEGDEIIFDITHSFRSIPMLAITIINYAKVLKNCTLKGIYYGAYEAAEIVDGVKYAPILNLTVYNEILEWTNAAEAFIRYGTAIKMQKVYEEKMQKLREENEIEVFIEKRKEWGSVKIKIDAVQNLASCILTGRGTDAKELKMKKPFEKSIKNAYEQLVQASTDESKVKAREIKPLYPLLEKIEERYGTYFKKEKNYEIGCGVVEWSIQNNMVQQGYTALEETIKTYLCDRYELDDKLEDTRDNIVGRILTAIGHREGSIEEFEILREKEADKVCMEIVEKAKLRPEVYNGQYKEKINQIIVTVPISLVVLSNKVKEKRNDINHFGFRKNPVAAKDLKKQLEEYYKELIVEIEEHRKIVEECFE